MAHLSYLTAHDVFWAGLTMSRAEVHMSIFPFRRRAESDACNYES